MLVVKLQCRGEGIGGPARRRQVRLEDPGQVRWTAPILAQVTFYVAGNAADGADDPALDSEYTRQVQLREATVAAIPSTWSRVKALYAAR
jgi:hypothetical protein